MKRTHLLAAALAAGTLVTSLGCMEADGVAASDPVCDGDNGGLVLPDGFCAVVVADGLPAPRHMVVAANGDLFVALDGAGDDAGGVIALRDTTGDGRADIRERFDTEGGTGIGLWRGWLYFGRNGAVVRYRLPEGSLEPAEGPEVIVGGLRARGSHVAKSLVITPGGDLFVNMGSPSNSCQVRDRQPGSPGKDPCQELNDNAGIWRFDASTPGQTLDDGERYATGMRNTVALALNPADGDLYAAIHGRDQLYQNWGQHYTAEEGAELPAEKFVRVTQGADFGWPYCYYDQRQGGYILAPEYGGPQAGADRCADLTQPIIGFPGHLAPDGLTFYEPPAGGEFTFPQRYRGGAFIAFHGSWNRAPEPQEGAYVVFVPRNGNEFGPGHTVFAHGQQNWAETRTHRPTGVTVGPDGSLYVCDDAGGRIWRVIYRG